MALFQVVVRGPGDPPQVVDVPRFPWVIGRSRDCGLVLARPGIFDRHLTLNAVAGEGLVVEVFPGALAWVGEQEVVRHRIRHGEVVRLGTVSLGFVLAPARRRSLRVWEWLFWGVFAAMVVVQALVLLRFAP